MLNSNLVYFVCFHLLSINFFFFCFGETHIQKWSTTVALYVDDLEVTLIQPEPVPPYVCKSLRSFRGFAGSGLVPSVLEKGNQGKLQLCWLPSLASSSQVNTSHHASSWAKEIFGYLPGHPWQTEDLLSKLITGLSFLSFPSWLNMSSPSEQFVMPTPVLSRCHPTFSSPESRREPSWLYKQRYDDDKKKAPSETKMKYDQFYLHSSSHF